MDRWNNAVGREVGATAKTKDEVARRAAEALERGDLIKDVKTDDREYRPSLFGSTPAPRNGQARLSSGLTVNIRHGQPDHFGVLSVPPGSDLNGLAGDLELEPMILEMWNPGISGKPLSAGARLRVPLSGGDMAEIDTLLNR